MPEPASSLLRLSDRLRGNRSLERLRDIALEPLLSPDEVRDAQMHRLSRLLAHAEKNVPYYRTLFQQLGIRSTEITRVEELTCIPILTKEIIREQGEKLVRDDVPFDSLSPHHSGGSTGIPLKFYRDTEYQDLSMAGTYRNLAQAGWEPGEMIAFFWGWNDRLNQMSRLEFELRQRARRMYQFDPFRSGEAEMDDWVRKWPSIRPRVALGYASTIARFAEHIEGRGLQVPRLRGVFTTAERLFAPQRAVISRVFGCPVFDCYGSSEVQNIATECRYGRMHVNADFVVVETTAPEGAGASPLLVTSLRNYAMPFLRYRNEDCGRLVREECECGSGFPLMDLTIARESDNFTLPDGRVVHGEFFTHLMYGTEGISSFQFHQLTPERIVLSIVPNGGETARAEALKRARTTTESLAPGVHLEVREVASIPLSAAGKHRFTRSDVKLAPAGRG